MKKNVKYFLISLLFSAAVGVMAAGCAIENSNSKIINNATKNMMLTAETTEGTSVRTTSVVNEILLGTNWSAGGTQSGSSLVVPANSQLKAEYLKQLWSAGYTHLVFTLNATAASDNNTNYTNGGQWDRYWNVFTPNTNTDIRIDINEFHDGNTFYSLNFNAGAMTISNPRAYKSAETLEWTKSSSTTYFAVEHGYYGTNKEVLL